MSTAPSAGGLATADPQQVQDRILPKGKPATSAVTYPAFTSVPAGGQTVGAADAGGAIGRIWRSTIGRKVVMAATGLVMVGFLVGHVVGNLLVFRGREPMNAYAHFLKSNFALLWGVRALLLVSVVLHVAAVLQFTALKRAARPVNYARRSPQVSTFASKSMYWGGLVIALFIVFHLLHFTVGAIDPARSFRDHDAAGRPDVWNNVVFSFKIWWVTLLYVLAMVAIGLHIFHGFWSSFRTLGLSRPSGNPLHRRAATLLAAALWIGFTIIPVAIFAGMLD